MKIDSIIYRSNNTLENNHWNKYCNCNEYLKNQNMAYREVLRILTNMLNK